MNKTPPYVWPATSADSGWETTYGSTGHLHMGSLGAIPKSVNLATLGFSAGKLAIARALQDYGAYITDADGESTDMALFAEPTAAGELPADWNGGAGVFSRLQIVTNSTQTSVGGGGSPLACVAPAFIQ